MHAISRSVGITVHCWSVNRKCWDFKCVAHVLTLTCPRSGSGVLLRSSRLQLSFQS